MVRALFGLKGRIRRLRFWLYQFLLIVALCVTVLILSEDLMFLTDDGEAYAFDAAAARAVLILLFVTAVLNWIDFTVHVRRLHDMGNTGWFAVPIKLGHLAIMAWGSLDMYLMVAYPFIALFGVLPGTQGANDYGPNPRDRSPAEAAPPPAAAPALAPSSALSQARGKPAFGRRRG